MSVAALARKPSANEQGWLRSDAARASAQSQRRNLTFSGPLVGSWYLEIPLDLAVEIEDRLYVVSDDIFLMYGAGDTLEKALDDYALSLIELVRLTEDSVRTNPHDAPLLAALRRYVRQTA
jgi:hypothetical protein